MPHACVLKVTTAGEPASSLSGAKSISPLCDWTIELLVTVILVVRPAPMEPFKELNLTPASVVCADHFTDDGP
jgi:hypothetical protein